MYFLFLTFAVSVAAIALDSAKRPSDLTNLDSGRAVPVLEGSMGTATQDLADTEQAIDLPAQPPNPNPNPNSIPTLDQTIQLTFNEVPYPEFLEEICKYPKQLGCCWIQNGRKFCDYFSTIESKECSNYENWRCCDRIDRLNFVGINCKKFQVQEPAPKKEEQQPRQQQEPKPEQEQSLPLENWDLPNRLNWILLPGATDLFWQNK